MRGSVSEQFRGLGLRDEATVELALQVESEA